MNLTVDEELLVLGGSLIVNDAPTMSSRTHAA